MFDLTAAVYYIFYSMSVYMTARFTPLSIPLETVHEAPPVPARANDRVNPIPRAVVRYSVLDSTLSMHSPGPSPVFPAPSKVVSNSVNIV